MTQKNLFVDRKKAEIWPVKLSCFSYRYVLTSCCFVLIISLLTKMKILTLTLTLTHISRVRIEVLKMTTNSHTFYLLSILDNKIITKSS